MNPRYGEVARRAAHRCEYCQAPEAIFNFPFEVEHVIPPGHGGGDEDSNLALSCRACNLFKSNLIEARDPQTKAVTPLFNPRQDLWRKHFALDDKHCTIIGLTATGRATVACLKMNLPFQVTARRQWMALKLFPG